MTQPDSCDPCNCIPSRFDKDFFMQGVWQLLCGLLNGTGVAFTQLTQRAIGFGAVGSAYAVTGLVDANKTLRFLRVMNTLNTDVQISLNGTSDHYYVKAGTNQDIPFPGRIVLATDVYAKYVSAPGSGTLYVEGYY